MTEYNLLLEKGGRELSDPMLPPYYYEIIVPGFHKSM